jgi:protein tyrosine phosphatase (PTP) superfamily phosphohydrolase (DUF442 family)
MKLHHACASTLLLLAACSTKEVEPSKEAMAAKPAQVKVAAPTIPSPTTVESQDIHNLVQVTPWLYSGAQPHGEPSFAELKQLGVKTVVCVDGMKPDAEAAATHGIEVVHLPIGYDGVPAETQAALAQLAKERNEPIFVHCHHGEHRGPAAAAIMLRARDGATVEQANAFMTHAGTSASYTGLWRDVAAFDPQNPGTFTGGFRAAAEVGDFAKQMATVDRIWDRLKLCRAEQWKSPLAHPDISPAHEALMLNEAFRELVRLNHPVPDERFAQWMADSVTSTQALHAALAGSSLQIDSVEQAFKVTQASCKSCHVAFRN